MDIVKCGVMGVIIGAATGVVKSVVLGLLTTFVMGAVKGVLQVFS